MIGDLIFPANIKQDYFGTIILNDYCTSCNNNICKDYAAFFKILSDIREHNISQVGTHSNLFNYLLPSFNSRNCC